MVALTLLLHRLHKRSRSRVKLKKDPSGLWRYHLDSEFLRKESYGGSLDKESKSTDTKPVAVLEFHGDIRAKQHGPLAQLIDEVVVNKDELSGVVVVIESAGGMVSPYGHAFSQLERVRRAGLELTVCIDVVAASGGYLMSVPANKIVAAPFAIVGSIGVVTFVPNFRKFLQNHHIEPRTFTSGQFKRTVTLTDDATPEEVERFKEQLDAIHKQFISAVSKYRPGLKIAEATTGEYWTAEKSVSLELGLVDELSSSEEYLLELNRTVPLVYVSCRQGFWDEKFGRFGVAVGERLDRLSSNGESAPAAVGPIV